MIKMNEELIQNLVSKALEARTFSYSPYSNFQVGAALLCEDDTIYQGCNIENAAYGPANCAERTAIFKAVSEGKRKFKAIAIVGGPKEAGVLNFAYPCGVCRQVMTEFCDQDFLIIIGKTVEEYLTYTLEELLPFHFGPDDVM